jgi:hypothetical protein
MTYESCQLGTINKLFAQEMFEILQWHRLTCLWYVPSSFLKMLNCQHSHLMLELPLKLTWHLMWH